MMPSHDALQLITRTEARTMKTLYTIGLAVVLSLGVASVGFAQAPAADKKMEEKKGDAKADGKTMEKKADKKAAKKADKKAANPCAAKATEKK
jgi:hypothetical protein